MTPPLTTTPDPNPPVPKPDAPRSSLTWLWPTIQLIAAILIAGTVLVFLLWSPGSGGKRAELTAEVPRNANAVELIGARLIRVKAGIPLEKKLAVATVAREGTSAPLLKVTGAVVARLPPGKDMAEGRWDFSSPDLATAYADWIKARADVPFSAKQLATIRKLTAAKVSAQTDVVTRLKKLVEAGTDPKKDLDAAQAELLQDQLQGQKDEHEADTALKNAERTKATLERQLFQAGIDPELLLKATAHTAIVVAEVPEARVGLVQPGQACVAEFYAFPDKLLSGRVGSLAPSLSKERRTLRVFFELSDPQDLLKPGMFADIGLGTDGKPDFRQLLLAPADGVLHVGRADYMLVATEAGAWKVTEIKAGELYKDRCEILEGLKAGDRVIGAGAILLKPFVVQAIQGPAQPARGAAAAERSGP